mgnify:CR=1 FL=1
MLEKEYLGALPTKVQDDYKLAIDALNWTHSCTEMGLVGLTYWNEMHEATESALYHKMTAKEALARCRERVQQALDEAWATVKLKELSAAGPNWAPLFPEEVGKVRKRSTMAIRESLAFYGFISPWIIGFVCFTGGPIVASLYFSTTNYTILARPEFIGLGNYRTLC